MGEARRRSEQGLPPKQSKKVNNNTKKTSPLIPLDQSSRDKFFEITKKGAWIGIILLIIFWIIVRFIGPSAGWWIPADAH